MYREIIVVVKAIDIEILVETSAFRSPKPKIVGWNMSVYVHVAEVVWTQDSKSY